MTNHCPKCGDANVQDEVQRIHSKYGTSDLANYKIQLLFDKMLSEAIAELDAWHTGEPPEGVDVVSLKENGKVFIARRHGDKSWLIDGGYMFRGWGSGKQWREVRP